MKKRKGLLLLSIPLILSAFTHLWNPVGFPAIQTDEGTYMGRAVMVLKGLGLHENENIYTKPYDHPYFGQLFLACVLSLIDYPDSLDPSSGGVGYITDLYFAPRIIMGILAVIDTFIVYKIAECRYDRRVAVIGAVLFAVMPLSWLLRRIWLDPLQLPFLLCSVFFALKGLENKRQVKDKESTLLILLSGIFLGAAIFTKVPAITMVPLFCFLIMNETRKNWKTLGLWFIPVVTIPLLWPAYAISLGELTPWIEGFLWQASGRSDRPLWMALEIVFEMDPILLIVGLAGIIYAALKRDFLILFWALPFLLFLQWIGYVSYWFFIPIIPVFCISAARMIAGLEDSIRQTRTQTIFIFSTICCICVFGLVSTILLIGTHVNSGYFQLVTATAKLVSTSISTANHDNNTITLVGNRWVPGFSWILDLIFTNEIDYKFFNKHDPVRTNKVLLIVDRDFIRFLDEENDNPKQAHKLYDKTKTITKIEDNTPRIDRSKYPYTSLSQSRPLGAVELRANF